MNICSEETRHYPLVETKQNNVSEVDFPCHTGQQIITRLTNDIVEDINGDGLTTLRNKLTDNVPCSSPHPPADNENESSFTSLSRYFITKISLAV